MSKGSRLAEKHKKAAQRKQAKDKLNAQYQVQNAAAARVASQLGISPTAAAKLMRSGALEPKRP